MSRILRSRVSVSLAAATVACAISIPVLASAQGGSGAPTAVAAKKHAKRHKTKPKAVRGRHGREGRAGKEGTRGSEGREGRQGPEGKEGRQGPDGKEGGQGSTGAAGTLGAPGAPGATGAQGSTGQRGATGEQGPSEALTNDNRTDQEVTAEAPGGESSPTVINSLTLGKGDYVISDDGWAQGLSSETATIRCNIETGNYAEGIGESLKGGEEGTVYVSKPVTVTTTATYKFICYRFDANEMRFLDSRLTAIKVGSITEK